MINKNSGYVGYSMSNRAVEVYEVGEKPISKINKRDIEEFSAFLERKGIISFDSKSVSVGAFKEWLKWCGESSWHHTSKCTNETKFYSPYYSIFEESDKETLEKDTREDLISYFNLDNLKTFLRMIEQEEKMEALKREHDKLWEERRKR